MTRHEDAIKQSLEIINKYESDKEQAKNMLEYHASVNPHKTLAKVKEILERV